MDIVASSETSQLFFVAKGQT
uniref:Uncharacterized protein n=1 Tax=Anguilla anguilla TaxID=7936 RepID=A0A0E9T491_ANGAN